MAWGSVGTLGTQGANGSIGSVVLTTSAALEAGNVGILRVAVDNLDTTDLESSVVSGVQDSAGNVWTKLKEYTNGQGAAGAGITISLWGVKAGTALASGGTITTTFSNTTTRDAVVAAWEFTIGAGNDFQVAASNTQATDGADPGSLDATTTNAEHLRIRAIGSELNSATNFTNTVNWTAMTTARSRNNTSAVSVRGEFRIFTGTNAASDPTVTTADHASVYVALLETTPTAGAMMGMVV